MQKLKNQEAKPEISKMSCLFLMPEFSFGGIDIVQRGNKKKYLSKGMVSILLCDNI